MTDRETTLLTGRISRIKSALGRPMEVEWLNTDPLSPEEEKYLQETGEEFYWNELEWEKLTGEEKVDEEFLTELAFPGFLAFVRGLLLEEAMPDSLEPPRPRPSVVKGLLAFLSARIVALDEEAASTRGEDREHREVELKMTSRLVDLVIYHLFKLDHDEIARVESALVEE